LNNLQSILDNSGISPTECCRAIRYVVLTFLRNDLPDGLYPYQNRVSDLILELATAMKGEEGIVNQCRQSGKTEAVVISLIVLAIYYCRVKKKNFRVGIFAPAATQTILTVKERLRKRCNGARRVLQIFGVRLVVGEGLGSELFILQHRTREGDEYDFRVRCFSISPDANITSETLNLIIIEQSEDVDPMKMTNDVFPMAAAVGGARILDGTPKNEVINTYFYDACTKREEGPRYLRVVYTEAQEFNPKYKAYCEEMIDKLGIDSIAFRTQYGCEWRLGVDKLCILEDLVDLSRKHPVILPIVDGRPMFVVGGGWDVAKSLDRSVFTLGWREGEVIHVVKWIVFEGDDYTDQVDAIAQALIDNGASSVLMDSAGVGDPTMDLLRKSLREKEGGVRVKIDGVKTNLAMEDDINSKLLVTAVKEGLFDFPSKEECEAMGGVQMRKYRDMFLSECCDLEKHWNGNMLKTKAPKGQDRHDDFPKSLGLLLRCLLKPPVKISIRAVDY